MIEISSTTITFPNNTIQSRAQTSRFTEAFMSATVPTGVVNFTYLDMPLLLRCNHITTNSLSTVYVALSIYATVRATHTIEMRLYNGSSTLGALLDTKTIANVTEGTGKTSTRSLFAYFNFAPVATPSTYFGCKIGIKHAGDTAGIYYITTYANESSMYSEAV